MGVAGHPGERSLDIDRLLREADGALYEAKERGRDQAQAYRPFSEDERPHEGDDRRGGAQPGGEDRPGGVRGLQSPAPAGALAERPGWAGGTSQLIADLAADIGRAVGLPDGDIERIRTASLLHDLGKLAIPDEILSKPAPLTPLEWRTIVEHPEDRPGRAGAGGGDP